MKNEKIKIASVLMFTMLLSNVVNSAINTNEKTIKSKIENVTVFTQGAQVYETSAITVNPGISTLVFENLEPTIDARSIQASGLGNFVIMDVEQNIKYPEPIDNTTETKSPKNLKQIKLLQDSIVMIDFDIEEITTKQDALLIEKNTLLNNRMIKGETKKDTLNLVKEALTFLREKLANINSELLKLKKDAYRVNAKKQRMQSDLQALQNYNVNTGDVTKDETNYRIIVTVSADAAVAGTINLNYFLQNAGWTPSYDLRAKANGGTIQLTYKAQVYQQTGIDWNDVKLTLSTANPNQNNVKPVLSTWWLNYFEPYNYYYKSAEGYNNAPQLSTQGKIAYDSEARQEPAKTIADHTVAEETFTNVEYEIKINYSIPSDGKTHLVAIQSKEISANYTYFSVPKMDKDAFLVAKISNWDDLNLVAGNANIYFDGTFVGSSSIDPNNLTDTLSITLGRDKNMVVTRTKQKDKTKEKIIGDEKIKTVSYEITVRNTKSSVSDFNLQDQIPISQNKDIVIEVKENSGGEVDEATGIVNWKFNIKPKETKKMTITYSIKFPKNKALAGL